MTFSATETSNSLYPSEHSAVTSARSIRVLPEQNGFSPDSCQPSAVKRAVVPSGDAGRPDAVSLPRCGLTARLCQNG